MIMLMVCMKRNPPIHEQKKNMFVMILLFIEEMFSRWIKCAILHTHYDMPFQERSKKHEEEHTKNKIHHNGKTDNNGIFFLFLLLSNIVDCSNGE